MTFGSVLTALALLAASCATVAVSPDATPSSVASSISAQRALAPGGELGDRSHEAGAVTVVASWLAGSTPVAKVTLDTHSVDLDGFDLANLARVRIDGGAWRAPSSLDVPKGGHHRSGTLTFAALDPEAWASARVIELEIRDIGSPSHLLRWEPSR